MIRKGVLDQCKLNGRARVLPKRRQHSNQWEGEPPAEPTASSRNFSSISGSLGLLNMLAVFVVLLTAPGCASLHIEGKAFRLASLTNPTDEFRRGAITNEESAAACIAIAENLEKSGHLSAAAAQYERARRQDASKINYAHRLGVLYARLDRTEDARREFSVAMSQSPDNIDVKNDYAYFLTQAGNPTESETILREILVANPSHRRAKINLGINLTHQGRLSEAYPMFSKAVGPWQAHHNIGVVLAERGKHQEAAFAFERAEKAQENRSHANPSVSNR